jgi:hypothetical protein
MSRRRQFKGKKPSSLVILARRITATDQTLAGADRSNPKAKAENDKRTENST